MPEFTIPLKMEVDAEWTGNADTLEEAKEKAEAANLNEVEELETRSEALDPE